MKVNLFGFEIVGRRKEEEEKAASFAPPLTDDGGQLITAGGFTASYMDLEGQAKSEAELVTRYRRASLQPEVEMAIDEITNEAISFTPENKIVELVMDDVPISPELKQVINQEFENILRLLSFESKAYEIFRQWYIDGRLYYHAIIDNNDPSKGITELRYIDPRNLRKVKMLGEKKRDGRNIKQKVTEYFVYSPRGYDNRRANIGPTFEQGIRISKDSIVYSTSGLLDETGQLVLSYLHKALKAINQVRTLEDAAVIYRLVRAPERRIFYVDVGNLPKMKAEQYLHEMMIKHKNKLRYNAETGEVRDDRRFITMIDDFWIPRREGSRGTEIDTLPAGENLGQMADVEYFLKKLYQTLSVPNSRMNPDQPFSIGRTNEITRDELKFFKFIARLRMRFANLFISALEKQLILKNIVTYQDWKNIVPLLRFNFTVDNTFAELRDAEILTARVELANMVMPFVGRYVSNEYIRRNILKQSDEEMMQIDQQIIEEMQNPLYNPPEVSPADEAPPPSQ